MADRFLVDLSLTADCISGDAWKGDAVPRRSNIVNRIKRNLVLGFAGGLRPGRVGRTGPDQYRQSLLRREKCAVSPSVVGTLDEIRIEVTGIFGHFRANPIGSFEGFILGLEL